MEIPSDMVFTNVEITQNIIHNGKVILDFVNSILYIDKIVTSNIAGQDLGGIREISGGTPGLHSLNNFDTHASVLPFEDQDEILRLKGEHNVQNSRSLAIGGELNESTGVYSSSLGGMYNESSGDNSITLGGLENKAYGKNCIAMGAYTHCNHDNTFMFNNNQDEELESTMDKQFMIGSENGVFFKLPSSSSIHTHHIPEGFACWCWDSKLKTTVLKTKQDNEMYKTIVPTDQDHLKIKLKTLKHDNQIHLGILNPDNF